MVSLPARSEVAVAAGHSVLLMTLASIDQVCHSQGQVTVNVVEPPRGGYIQVVQTKAFPNFNALNTRSRCNTIKLPATRVIYQSAGNFLGTDFVTVEVIFPEGGVKRVRVPISVRPIAPGAVYPDSKGFDATGVEEPHASVRTERPKTVRPKATTRSAGAPSARPVTPPGCRSPCTSAGGAGAPEHPDRTPAQAPAALTPI